MMHNKHLSEIKSTLKTNENQLFADEEHPALRIRDKEFARCTFIRIGLKKAELDKIVFHRCVFEDCYFRRVSFHNVDFTGSFFKECNLERATFESCRFRYVRFSRCRLDYREVLHSLPGEPNIALELLKSLQRNATEMRDTEVVDRLLAQQIDLEKRELKNRVLGVSEYYRTRYKGLDRWLSVITFGCVTFSGWFWGHGMRLRALFRSAGILISAFGVLFYLCGDFSSHSAGSRIGFLMSLYLSIATFTTLGYSTAVPASALTYFLCALESILGVVFLGFLAAAVYRKLSR